MNIGRMRDRLLIAAIIFQIVQVLATCIYLATR